MARACQLRPRGPSAQVVKVGRAGADTGSVQFSVRRPEAEIARGALLTGLAACSLAVPMVITFLVDVSWRHDTALWVAAILTIGVPIAYIAWRLRTSAGDPRVAFAVVCCALASISLVDVAAHDVVGVYRPVLLVPVAFVVLIGDRRMVVATWALVVVAVAVTSYEVGVRGRVFASELVLFAAVAALLGWMTNRSVATLHRYVDTRNALHELDEAIADAESVDDAVRRGLPLVGGVVGGAQVDVWSYPSAGGPPLLVASHPPLGPGDEVRAVPPDPSTVRACLERNRPVVQPEQSFVPVGYSTTGVMVLAVHHPRHERERLLHLRAIGDELAAVFLRTTSRAAFVAGLRTDARTDVLTGLPNRRALVERLDTEIARAARDHAPLSVGMADLDHFKQYNDGHGHVAGDALLRAVAGRLVASLRRTDTVARYGGEEFCVLLPGTDLPEAVRVLDEARQAVKHDLQADGITISAGVATMRTWDGVGGTTGTRPLDLVDRADRALYRAKDRGRDRVVPETEEGAHLPRPGGSAADRLAWPVAVGDPSADPAGES